MESAQSSSREQNRTWCSWGRAQALSLSFSLCRKEICCSDFYWLEEQREGPWQGWGLQDTKGRSSSSVQFIWGARQALEKPWRGIVEKEEIRLLNTLTQVTILQTAIPLCLEIEVRYKKFSSFLSLIKEKQSPSLEVYYFTREHTSAGSPKTLMEQKPKAPRPQAIVTFTTHSVP